MPYQFERGRIYRMPTHFGPAPGPRQMPMDALADSTRSPQKTLITASFLTDASALERHTPEGFQLAGESVVTIEFHYMTHIDWLAGRGYTMIQLWWPVTFKGERDRVTGRFLAVMWENLADPIITGRGEVGQPKLFAEIPDSLVAIGTIAFRRAAWADLPTMYHVVNALAELPFLGARGASISRTRGGKSYRDSRILK